MKKRHFIVSVRDGLIGLCIVLVAVGGYGWYERSMLLDEKAMLEQDVAELEEILAHTQQQLSATENERTLVSEALANEQAKLESVSGAFDEIRETVVDLDKLSKLEPELLQKYSRVYFLNEHYAPTRLREIETEFLYIESEPELVDARVLPFLEELLEDAHGDGIELFVASAYRSFGEQGALKAGYTVNYGSGANAFSADQGYSEHQLGTTVDFITTGIGGTLPGFGDTVAYEWLLENAHTYGFTLSYPEGNTFYIFEPWHWRFVGIELAYELRDDGIFFYDLPQHDIDQYLLEIFD